MDIIITVIIIFAISIIFFSFINLKLSLLLYISYLILVPYLKFNIGGIPLTYNLIILLLLIIFLYHFQIEQKIKLKYQVVIPFLFLHFSLFFLSLFTWNIPLRIQFDYWRVSVMQTCIMSFIIWNFTLVYPKNLIYIKLSLIISIVIAGIYGIILLRMEGLNPYTSFISNYFGIMDSADIYSDSESRLDFSTTGKIQSTMIHPMLWTLILCLSLVIFILDYLKTKNKIYWILFVIICFNILTSGVRTGIAALVIGFVYYLIRRRSFKLIILESILVIALVIVVQSNKELSNLVNSFVDVSGQESDVQGSSISMRLIQFRGALEEIKGHELFGKGYGWTTYYMAMYGDHPILLAFESLLFVILCNNGYIGLLIWIFFFILLYRLHRNILDNKADILLMDTFVIIYLAYAIGTGEYGYLQFFSIFYSFQLSYLYNKCNTKTKNLHYA